MCVLINPIRYHESLVSTPGYVPSLGQHSRNRVTGPVLSNTLRRRTDLEGDWEVHFFDGPAYFPVESAASVLVQFYLHIMEQAVRNELSQAAPSQHFSYNRGNLRLSFLCRQGPVVSHRFFFPPCIIVRAYIIAFKA